MISACPAHSREMTGRHDWIQTVLMDLLWILGIEALYNARPEERGRLVPNITVNVGATSMYIEVTAPFDEPVNMYRAGQEKRDKYLTSERSSPYWLGLLGPGSPKTTSSGRLYTSPITDGTPPGCGWEYQPSKTAAAWPKDSSSCDGGPPARPSSDCRRPDRDGYKGFRISSESYFNHRWHIFRLHTPTTSFSLIKLGQFLSFSVIFKTFY